MKYSIFLLLFPVIISCKKENNASPLMMRIKNVSGNVFSYSYSSGKEFGIIANGATTEYKQFDNISAYTGARVAIGSDTTYAGILYCGTPSVPESILENGRYTMEIFEDNSTIPGFLNTKLIKDR